MSQIEIDRFQRNPYHYIQNKPVDLTITYDPYTYVFEPPASFNRAEKMQVMGFLNSCNLVRVDLHPVMDLGSSWVGFRLLGKGMVPPQFKEKVPGSDREREVNISQGTFDAFPEPPENPIEAYYFPYKYGGITAQSIEEFHQQVGWVDVPKKPERYEYVFTGSMQGCELVVTESPDRDDHYRFYHFQNASSNTKYRYDGSIGFPTQKKIIYWFKVDQYAIEDHPFAWNFFRFEGERWHLYSQSLYYRGDPTVKQYPELREARRINITTDPFSEENNFKGDFGGGKKNLFTKR